MVSPWGENDLHRRKQYINIPLTSTAIIIVALVLPLKRVKGDVKAKLKKVDYLGCLIMFTSVILILLPLSWYVYSSIDVISDNEANQYVGEGQSMLGAQRELLPLL